MSDEENPATPTCSLPHCDERAQSDACCSGASPHYLCDSCFCGYASSHFVATGAFEKERINDGNIVSSPGELPCYRFLMNECDCACISAATLARVLSTDPIALKRYELAKRRLIRAQYDKEQADTGAARVQQDQDSSPIERLYRCVADALSRGRYVACPKCQFHGEKDNACMHMKCPCGTRYCYCCGRERGDGEAQCKSDGSGCDYPSPYLENHPGWGSLALNGESAGAGALHEFHKRRMAYFLRQIKVNYPADLWEQLREDHPTLLDGDPEEGVRPIEWHEIDAAEPPLFGPTTVEELEWKDDGLLTCVDHVVDEPAHPQHHKQRNEDHAQEQTPQEDRNQQDGRRRERIELYTFVKNHPVFIACWVVGLLLAIVMSSVGAANDNQALVAVGKVFIAGVVGTGLPLLAMRLVEYFAANPQEGCIPEVQCIRGRNEELPYLATRGRWSQRRVLYWYSFFCGIALASLCLASKGFPVVYGFGAFLFTDIVLLYGGITLLVNFEPPPPQAEPLRTLFKHFVTRVCIYITNLSIGVGLLSTPRESYNANVAGKVFFASGFAGAFAELLPRTLQVSRGGHLFIHTPDTHQLVLSYIMCMGVALGSLMVGLSYSGPVNIAGITVLVVSLLLFCPAFSAR